LELLPSLEQEINKVPSKRIPIICERVFIQIWFDSWEIQNKYFPIGNLNASPSFGLC
jgi:hypothetical protein